MNKNSKLRTPRRNGWLEPEMLVLSGHRIEPTPIFVGSTAPRFFRGGFFVSSKRRARGFPLWMLPTAWRQSLAEPASFERRLIAGCCRLKKSYPKTPLLHKKSPMKVLYTKIYNSNRSLPKNVGKTLKKTTKGVSTTAVSDPPPFWYHPTCRPEVHIKVARPAWGPRNFSVTTLKRTCGRNPETEVRMDQWVISPPRNTPLKKV